MNLEPGTTVDRYVVEAQLGAGGMAAVYRVRHGQLGTPHALKVLSVHHHSVRERLILEGKVQARLQHRNVLAVTDIVEVHDSPGLLMEYVRGPSLDRVLEHGALDLEIVDALVPGILAGIFAAHNENVVHRDLKPANVLLATKRGQVVPKVADFGLVKLFGAESSGQTRTGTAMGTPEYMSPEQIRDSSQVDQRTDMFALGAMLYELATGVRAFSADDNFEIFRKITSGDFIPPQERRPDLPARMVRAIEAALTVDRDDRIADCEALWQIWGGADARPLEAAAAANHDYPQAFLDQLEQLSHPAVTGAPTTSDPPAAPTQDWLSASSVVDEPSPAPAPTRSDPPSGSAITIDLGRTAPVAILLALIAGAFAAAGVLAAATIYVSGVFADPPPEATPTPPPQVVVAPAPVPAPAPLAPEPKVEAKKKTKKKQTRRVRPAPAPPPAPAAPAPPSTGDVVVTGDAPWVRLVPSGGGSAVKVPGAVAAGKYTVEAPDSNGKPTRFGVVTVPAGGRITLKCVTQMRNCRVE